MAFEPCTLNFDPLNLKKTCNPCLKNNIAERQGFEPWEQLPVHRISSAARSTTPASFRREGTTFF